MIFSNMILCNSILLVLNRIFTKREAKMSFRAQFSLLAPILSQILFWQKNSHGFQKNLAKKLPRLLGLVLKAFFFLTLSHFSLTIEKKNSFQIFLSFDVASSISPTTISTTLFLHSRPPPLHLPFSLTQLSQTLTPSLSASRTIWILRSSSF